MDESQFPAKTSNNTNNSDSNTIAILMWIGSIFFSFVPALVVYLIKKEDPFVQDHAKEALNWAITLMVGYAIAGILMLILIGFVAAFALAVTNLVFCLLGAVSASKGETYRLPFAIRLIK
ncbi:DUF4870 domain-containing protein [Iodobacter arcticus]|uniref:DUF4870 domain-containing protein n=1 Tax=Iodobacter arcticus TaxID=590593 RepID=A0ABW2R1C9_9NEIS